jgi:hypothetical protein
MKNSAVRFVLILIVSSVFLPTAILNRDMSYAQSPPMTTNATVSSGEDNVNSQSRLQNQSVNYYGNASGYLVYSTPASISNNATTQGGVQEQQKKLPAVVMIHEWWGFE